MMMTASLTLEDLMASRPTPLSLRAHHSYKSWSTDWRDDSGRRRTKRFGKEHEVGTKEATARYQNWLASEWTDKEHVRNPSGESATYTVKMLCEQYEAFAKTHYVKRGKGTTFLSQVKSALERFRLAYGDRKVCDLDAPMVAKLRESMIQSQPDDDGNTRALMRGTVNDRLHVIKQAVTWAHTEKGRISVAVAWSISQVKPLAVGRSAAKEPEPVPPIADAIVAKVLRHGTKILDDMIRLQRLSGMRPEEVCIIRGMDLDITGDVWIYQPAHHKTEHHDKKRFVYFGKRAQRIIRRRFKPDLTAYLFTPKEAVAEWQAKVKQAMKTRAGAVYTTRSYRQAIHRACKRADVDKFNPNQLRHAWATEVRKAFDLEAAAIGLGHSDIRTAEIYAERDQGKAMMVARKVG